MYLQNAASDLKLHHIFSSDLRRSLAAPSHQPSASFCAMGVATASHPPQTANPL